MLGKLSVVVYPHLRHTVAPHMFVAWLADCGFQPLHECCGLTALMPQAPKTSTAIYRGERTAIAHRYGDDSNQHAICRRLSGFEMETSLESVEGVEEQEAQVRAMQRQVVEFR